MTQFYCRPTVGGHEECTIPSNGHLQLCFNLKLNVENILNWRPNAGGWGLYGFRFRFMAWANGQTDLWPNEGVPRGPCRSKKWKYAMENLTLGDQKSIEKFIQF